MSASLVMLLVLWAGWIGYLLGVTIERVRSVERAVARETDSRSESP